MGTGSLRRAISDANGSGGADSIEFDANVFASPQTITLNTGEMLISDGVTITGPASHLTIDANHLSRVFSISIPGTNDQNVAISDLTLTNGKIINAGGGAI